MASVNKVILIGRLGRDPESRVTAQGDSMVNFSLATDSGRGEKKTTTWHRVVCYKQPAEFIKNYIKKGDPLYLEGTIINREWDDKSGNKKQITEIKAYTVESLGSKQSASPSRYTPGEDREPDDDLPF